MRSFTVFREGQLPNHDSNQKNAANVPQFEGVIWSDGTVAVRWLTACGSTSVWDNFQDMMAVHGHLNDETHQTKLVWDNLEVWDSEKIKSSMGSFVINPENGKSRFETDDPMSMYDNVG